MGTNTKLQKAGRTFLLRLVAEYGPIEAATILGSLADEIEALGPILYQMTIAGRPKT